MIKDEETIIATIGDVTDISANLDNNESIVINPGGTADITGIVEAEEQRVQNENERISNENDRETYINDLKERVLNGEFNGQDGQPGEKGDKGDKGDTGEQGIQGIPGERGTDGTDGISPTITTSKQGKVTTLTIVDADGTHTAKILDGADGSGTGDMLKSTYDTNENGIVDNAELVNNHSVLSDVPANAVFTDTTYTAGTGIDITNGVISNTQTSANWGNITGTLSNQTDLQNALDQKANISNLSDVAISGDYDDLIDKPTLFSGDYNDLTNKPTIPVVPTNVSAFTNDSGYITSASLPTKTSDLTNDSGFVTSNTTNSTLTYDPGASVVHTILRDSANNSVTADIPTASTSEAGVMSSADKTKLNGLQNYTAGDNITITNGVINASNIDIPVGSEIEYNGSVVPDGYEEVETHSVLKAYTLYNNASGSSASITLSDSINNYDYIEIFCKDSNGVSSSTKVENPNGKKVTLMTVHIDTGLIQFYTKNVLINATSITNIGGYTIKMQSSSITAFNNSYNYILITKVVGYKEEL